MPKTGNKKPKVIHANRYEQFDEAFLRYLGRYLPGFKGYAKDVRLALCGMIYEAPTRYRAHSHHEGYSRFTWQELEQSFGRKASSRPSMTEPGSVSEVSDRCWLFKLKDSARTDDNFTKGYWFTDLVQASRDKYFDRRWRKETRLLFIEGQILKAQKTLPGAFASTDTKGKATRISRAAKGSKELRHVPVDLETLGRVRKWLTGIKREWLAGRAPHDLVTQYPSLVVIERLYELTSQVIRMAKTDVAGHGYIAQQYTESPSGRWYANGVNLQNSSSLIKEAALAGLWEYDFSNCHFDIIKQMAKEHDYECKAIADYLDAKKPTRQAIADQVGGITPDDAKVCLLSVMYGARASTWHECDIPKKIGKEAAERLYKVALFKGIVKDVARARAVILKKWPRTANGSLTNAYGKAISGTDKKVRNAQKLAHLIQGAEAKALMVVIDMHPNDLVLLQHDGFVATRKLYVPDITKAVLQATGYLLEMEESRIQVNPDAPFLKYRIKTDSSNIPQ
jgi:hypothetical protein